MSTKSAYCNTCKRKTVHQEFNDRAISGTKIAANILLAGGLPIFGIRKGKNYYCVACGTPES